MATCVQYVHVDVTSSCFSNGMFYYTSHNNMVAPQYVHVDAPSSYIPHCMFSYTLPGGHSLKIVVHYYLFQYCTVVLLESCVDIKW
jgi:hypothetical protein